MPAPPVFQVNLHCPDVGKEFAYLTGVVGLPPEFRVRDKAGRTVFAGVRTGARQGGRIILGDIEEALHGHYDHGAFGKQMEEHPLGTGAVVYCYVPDVDKAYARARARGAVVDEPPTDQFWGDRTASLITPAGYYVTLATPIRGFRFPPGFHQRFDAQYFGRWSPPGGRAPARGKSSRRKAR
jgi:uncharacterized glyoxalase superfamily protein PhnB